MEPATNELRTVVWSFPKGLESSILSAKFASAFRYLGFCISVE
jgi:hypothetical protein